MYRIASVVLCVLAALAAAVEPAAVLTASAATTDLARPATQPKPSASVTGDTPATGPAICPCPRTLSGLVNSEVFCVRGETLHMTGNTQVYSPGRLALRGGTLIFDGPYSLEFYNGAELTLDSSDVMLQQGNLTGYSISTQSQAIVNITGTQARSTTITGAARVTIDAANARIDNLAYSGNASGLVLTAAFALVTRSRFFDNHDCGLRVTSSADRPITVRSCEFFASADTQDVGILLDRSQNALVDSNYIHHNSKAGVRLFVPYPDSLDGPEAIAVTPSPVPNRLRVNRIEHNADGIIEYTQANTIENAGLIDHNTNYGYVGIDIWDQPIQYIGVHNGAKMLHLRSTRVGAFVDDLQGHIYVPDRTVYVAACEWDIGCGNPVPLRSDARHYEDYSIAHTRVKIDNLYFTSDLASDGVLRTLRGVQTVFTPRFLLRDYYVDNSNQEVGFCFTYPDLCSMRAVTLYGQYSEEHGRVFDGWPTRRQRGDEFGYFIFTHRGQDNYALLFGDAHDGRRTGRGNGYRE